MKQTLTEHRFAAIFPLMEGEDFERLVADIRENGQVEPITVMNGMILDGRNRYRACQEIGIEPYTIDYEGDDPLAFVLSLNLHRRHLSESQRAMVAEKLANLSRGGARGVEQSPNLGFDPVAPAVTRKAAAEMLNVGKGTLEHARTVQREGAPEIVKAVEAGRVAVSAAAQVARLPVAEQQAVAAAGDKAIAEKARELREAKKAPEPAPPSNVVQLAPRQPALPAFDLLDKESEADEAADEAREGPDVDLDTLEGRAHAFNGALSTLDIIALSGREYWSVFCKDPAKTVYETWVRSALAKLTDIVKELDDAKQSDAKGSRKPKAVSRDRR